MSNEEFERYKEFILGHQAQFAASIQEHNERFARLEETVAQMAEHIVQLDDIVNRLAAVTLTGFKDVNAKIDALVDSHIRLSDAQERRDEAQKRAIEAQQQTDEAQKRTNEALARLTEAQARTEANQAQLSANQALTEEALRKLIATVERNISEGHNAGKNSDK
ncbi:MAG TPA: hypothetical protein VJT74_10320 [Pyrinomonadaceae bacterium]|nr:hypothetical protein [Pyrinomonadaceae bacterium]